ncbi:hypothetical protein JCM6882_002522 [Rhodosporidiobolus microsporus]
MADPPQQLKRRRSKRCPPRSIEPDETGWPSPGNLFQRPVLTDQDIVDPLEAFRRGLIPWAPSTSSSYSSFPPPEESSPNLPAVYMGTSTRRAATFPQQRGEDKTPVQVFSRGSVPAQGLEEMDPAMLMKGERARPVQTKEEAEGRGVPYPGFFNGIVTNALSRPTSSSSRTEN